MLNNSGENGHPCLVPNLRGTAFSFSPLKIKSAVGLSYMTFTMLSYLPSMSIFWRVLIINCCWILSKAFYSSIEIQFSSVTQLCPSLCDPMDRSTQASQSNNNPWSPPKLMSIELVMSSNHLILYCSLLLLPSIFPKSGSFQMSQLFASGGQSIEFQLQHQSFQWTPRTDLL